MKTNFNLSAVILFFIGVTSGCTKPLQPQYKGFDNLQINKVDAGESLVSANIKFYNPNKFPLELKQADVLFFLNDKQTAHCRIDSIVNIPRLDSFYVPVTFKIGIAGILKNAFQLLLSSKAKINAEGFIKFKKSGMVFNVPVHYETYQNIDSLIQNIQ
ncbi:MAG TPA: LEA type 2 family protein [Puia sp.]|nr:LEA type 2 family protein [Puia sp.]